MHMRAHVFGDLLDIKGLLPCSLRRVSQVNPEFAHLEALMTYFPQGLPSSLPSKVGATGIQQSFGSYMGLGNSVSGLLTFTLTYLAIFLTHRVSYSEQVLTFLRGEK